MTKLIFEVMCFTVVLERADKPGSTPGDAVFCFFVKFFFLFGLFFFNTNFPFGLFFFILTADPAGSWIKRCKRSCFMKHFCVL